MPSQLIWSPQGGYLSVMWVLTEVWTCKKYAHHSLSTNLLGVWIDSPPPPPFPRTLHSWVEQKQKKLVAGGQLVGLFQGDEEKEHCMYDMMSCLAGVVVAPYAAKSDEQNDRSEDSIYYDALNIWVGLFLLVKENSIVMSYSSMHVCLVYTVIVYKSKHAYVFMCIHAHTAPPSPTPTPIHTYTSMQKQNYTLLYVHTLTYIHSTILKIHSCLHIFWYGLLYMVVLVEL